MTLIDKAEALLPRPFCGGRASLVSPAMGRPYVCCDDNYCTGPKPSAEQAIAAWNRRAAIPARGVGVKPDRDTFDAMCAMRNSINEHIPMPSLESDLLQGPENSVFCATVAEAVIAEVSRLRGIISGTAVKQLEWHNFDAWTHWAEAAETALAAERAKVAKLVEAWGNWHQANVERSAIVVCGPASAAEYKRLTEVMNTVADVFNFPDRAAITDAAQAREAALRLRAYVGRRKRARGFDQETVHTFDAGTNSEASLTVADLEAILALIGEARRPNGQPPMLHATTPAPPSK